MNLLVHGKFSCLAEGSRAPIEVTLKRFLLCVDVSVLFQILSKRERLEAQHTYVLFDG